MKIKYSIKLFSDEETKLSLNKSFIILGKLGSGKTVLSKNILISLHEQTLSQIFIISETNEYNFINNNSNIFIKNDNHCKELFNFLKKKFEIRKSLKFAPPNSCSPIYNFIE